MSFVPLSVDPGAASRRAPARWIYLSIERFHQTLKKWLTHQKPPTPWSNSKPSSTPSAPTTTPCARTARARPPHPAHRPTSPDPKQPQPAPHDAPAPTASATTASTATAAHPAPQQGALHHICMGRRHAGTRRPHPPIHDLHIRVVRATDGHLLRQELQLDPYEKLPTTNKTVERCPKTHVHDVPRLDPWGFGQHRPGSGLRARSDRRGYPRGLIIGVPGRLFRSGLALVRSKGIPASSCVDRVCRVGRSWTDLEALRYQLRDQLDSSLETQQRVAYERRCKSTARFVRFAVSIRSTELGRQIHSELPRSCYEYPGAH